MCLFELCVDLNFVLLCVQCVLDAVGTVLHCVCTAAVFTNCTVCTLSARSVDPVVYSVCVQFLCVGTLMFY